MLLGLTSKGLSGPRTPRESLLHRVMVGLEPQGPSEFYIPSI